MASYHAAAARRRRATGPAPSLTGPASDVHPVLRRATAPPAALDLLAQARTGLDEAAALETPNERYATAHLAALRTAAAVLAARGRPETTARRRGTRDPQRLGGAARDRARTRRVERAVRLRAPRAGPAPRRASRARRAAATPTTCCATRRCSCAWSSGCWCSSRCCRSRATGRRRTSDAGDGPPGPPTRAETRSAPGRRRRQ